ncbi:MAG TPA: HigA family addiction module antitoxin [Azospirillaceae bacterium]|nr:HigA family addiction module antitoxin [Azospirillaceae bacterium]
MVTAHPVHPGAALRDRLMTPLGLSVPKLASTLGVSVRRIQEIVRGRRGVSRDTAHRLEVAWGTPAQFWLDLQRRYDDARHAPR